MPKAKEQLSQEPTKITKASQESRTIKKSKKDVESSQGSATSSPAKGQGLLESLQPKKVMTSYMCFINARRPGFVESNPNLSMCEAVSALAKVWNSLTPDQKVQYDKIAAVDQKRFDKETKEI
jgi:hypothetical protein